MDYPELNLHKERLHQQSLSEAIQKNEERTQILSDYQKKHKQVLEGLQIIPLELTVRCLVPIGKQAFMEGKLKHTNEILVCLGEGYFINYTAAQAIELCNRRINRVEKVLDDLKKERNLFESLQFVPLNYEAFGGNLKEEIIEYWNDQDLEKWRAQHRQREKEYHETLSQQKQQRKTYSETEEDLFQRLDELELEEELADEYYRLHEDNEGDKDSEDSEEEEEEEEEEEAAEAAFTDSEKDIIKPLDVQLKKVENCPEISLPSSKETNDHDEIRTNENLKQQHDLNKACEENKDQLVKNRRVSFADAYDEISSDNDESVLQPSENSLTNDELDYYKITFSHSEVLPQLIDQFSGVLNSPGDIYNIFYKPKSILKRSSKTSHDRENSSLPKERALGQDFESGNLETPVFNDVITNTVQEKKVVGTQAETTEPVGKKKPASRFRLERASLNK